MVFNPRILNDDILRYIPVAFQKLVFENLGASRSHVRFGTLQTLSPYFQTQFLKSIGYRKTGKFDPSYLKWMSKYHQSVFIGQPHEEVCLFL
jgi:hypothetical protein